jgi:hypothetical protein
VPVEEPSTASTPDIRLRRNIRRFGPILLQKSVLQVVVAAFWDF